MSSREAFSKTRWRVKKELEQMTSFDKDNLNLWYVAVTRAKKGLRLPPTLWKLSECL